MIDINYGQKCYTLSVRGKAMVRSMRINVVFMFEIIDILASSIELQQETVKDALVCVSIQHQHSFLHFISLGALCVLD